MKTLIIVLLLIGMTTQVHAQIEAYVLAVEKANQQYSQDIRGFYRGLDPNLTQFSELEKDQFCQINQQHVDQLYRAVEKNRSALGQKNISRQDVIQDVEKKHSVLAQKYNLKCPLK